MRCADKKQASAQTCGPYPFEVNYHSHGIIKVLEPDRVLRFQKIMSEDCITHCRKQEVYGK
jgi:hypothetical protein